jgi:hypothetical protein
MRPCGAETETGVEESSRLAFVITNSSSALLDCLPSLFGNGLDLTSKQLWNTCRREAKLFHSVESKAHFQDMSPGKIGSVRGINRQLRHDMDIDLNGVFACESSH